MRTRARIRNYEVSFLIDGGASHNFIDIRVVLALRLNGEGIRPLKVEITNGDHMECRGLARGVSMEVQSVEIAVDLLMLDLEDSGVILGNAWLRSIRRVLVDYGTMSMEFQLNEKQHSWPVMTTMKARHGDGPTRRLEEFKLWSGGEDLPMIWPVHKEEIANNFEATKAAEKDEGDARELLILVHASGIHEVEPVMARGGMTGQLEIEATLGIQGRGKCPQILAWRHMIKT